ncbi:MAG: rhomboid family intramembrane serine protease [Gemmataceae bacterium]|nr:rhomboid family intramembrane serine protease [Gemmataceae bacterium]
MADTDLLLRVLQACAQSPAPLFPAELAATSGIDRARLDEAIDRLRLNGYIQIADWVQGKGQGYTLTPAGAAALTKPTELRQPAAAPPEPAPERRRVPLTWERGELIRSALVEPTPPVVTMVLLFANLLMFAIGLGWALLRDIALADYFTGSVSVQLANLQLTLGALSTLHVILQDEWWRLVTYQFLHGGVLHLVVNMFALYNLGPLLEAIWGSKRYLPLYLVSGVMGGAAVLMSPTPSFVVGASGAICGLLGSFAVWLWLNRDYLPEQVTAAWRSSIITSLLLMTIISLPIGPLKRISWEGHLGGVLGGALFSMPLHFQRFGRPWQRLLSWLGFVLIPAAALALGYYIQTRRFDDLNRAWLNDQFSDRYLAAVTATEDYILARRNQFIVPVFHDHADAWKNDAGKVAALRKACEESLDRLAPLRADLAAFAPAEKTAAQEARAVRDYFDAWHELFDGLQRHLEQPAAWNPARRFVLQQQDTKVFQVREPLEKNTVLPPFRALAPAKQGPAPAKPPPNVA